jgi:glycosyltransferase involved in cell wall biosynthesis
LNSPRSVTGLVPSPAFSRTRYLRTISLVIPCYDEESGIDRLLEQLDKLAGRTRGYAFEIVCVNDGSTDATLQKLLEAAKHRPNLVIVDLSRNFGKEAALSAGIQVASGDAIVPMDADLQDSPDAVPEMIALWEQGYEVVIAQRSDRRSDHREAPERALLLQGAQRAVGRRDS